MDEVLIRNASVIISVAGLALIFLFSNSMEVKPMLIGEITSDSIGSNVKACGMITDRRVSNNHVFFGLKDETGEITAVVFNSTALDLLKEGNDIYSFRTGDSICVFGAVSEYPKGSGSLEIVHRKGKIEVVS